MQPRGRAGDVIVGIFGQAVARGDIKDFTTTPCEETGPPKPGNSSLPAALTVGFKGELTIYAMHGGGTRSENRVSFEDEFFRASLSTKTPAWDYEREWRYFKEIHGLFGWPGPLASVTFGLRMSTERRDFYSQLAHEFAGDFVEFFEIMLDSSGNGLNVAKRQLCKVQAQ